MLVAIVLTLAVFGVPIIGVLGAGLALLQLAILPHSLDRVDFERAMLNKLYLFSFGTFSGLTKHQVSAKIEMEV